MTTTQPADFSYHDPHTGARTPKPTKTRSLVLIRVLTRRLHLNMRHGMPVATERYVDPASALGRLDGVFEQHLDTGKRVPPETLQDRCDDLELGGFLVRRSWPVSDVLKDTT